LWLETVKDSECKSADVIICFSYLNSLSYCNNHRVLQY
jgi:hypothetical protein